LRFIKNQRRFAPIPGRFHPESVAAINRNSRPTSPEYASIITDTKFFSGDIVFLKGQIQFFGICLFHFDDIPKAAKKCVRL
jgi:indole-3-glycerol phosphate synthase